MQDSIKTIWKDGSFVGVEEAKESVLAHGLHFGAGVLEGVRYYDSKKGPALFHWDEHLERFFKSAALIGLEIEYKADELTKAACELVRRHDFPTGYIRPLSYYGPNNDGVSLYDIDDCPTRIALIVWERESKINKEGIDVVTSSWRQVSGTQIPSTAKLTGPYVGNMMAGREARRDGYDDAILLNSRGEVAEGATSNLVLIKDNEVFTPSPAADVLDGITKNAIVELARDLGYTVDSRTTIGRGELYNADELFLVGTGAEITPVVSVDGLEIGLGVVGTHTKQIRERFFEVVQRETEEYSEWFTYA